MIIAGLTAFFVAIITTLWIYASRLEKEAAESCEKHIATVKDCIKWMEKWKDSELKMQSLRKKLENSGVLNFEYKDVFDNEGIFVKKIRVDVWNLKHKKEEKTK